MGKLDNKIALVTGGSDGMGFYTAKLYVAEGAKVFITDHKREVGEAAAQKIGADLVQGDISKIEQHHSSA